MDISKLTAAQKRELLDQLKYELEGAGQARAMDSFSEPEEELWLAMMGALRLKATLAGMPAFAKAHGAAKFRLAATSAHEFVGASCNVALRKPERMAVLEHCMGCLTAHLQARGIPATVAILCNSMAVLPDAVNRRFPGYSVAGLLHKIAASPRGRDRGGASSR